MRIRHRSLLFASLIALEACLIERSTARVLVIRVCLEAAKRGTITPVPPGAFTFYECYSSGGPAVKARPRRNAAFDLKPPQVQSHPP